MTDARRLVLLISLVAVLFASVAVGIVAAQSAPDCSTVSYNGDGTEANPYEVGNVDQLQCINDQGLSANYTQVSDIDASGTSEWNNGKGFDPIGSAFNLFTGAFEGADHTVSELNINRGSTDDVGLFGGIGSGGRLENASLKNVDITGAGRVGGLVGVNRDEGIVVDSYANGNISGDGAVGGLFGGNFGGTIKESYATGSVSGDGAVGGLVGNNAPFGTVTESYANGSVSGSGDEVGGLVGQNFDGTITESYATGPVNGTSDVGGLIGFNGGTVTNSYATGFVSGDSTVSGLVGRNRFGTVTESYWDKQSTGQPDSDGGTGLTTSEMTGSAATSNMDGFDFTSTWETVPEDYPMLAWQNDDNAGPNPIGSDSNGGGEGDGGAEVGNDGSSGADGENAAEDSSGTEGGEGLPGFTVVTAVLALLTVVAVAIRRRTE